MDRYCPLKTNASDTPVLLIDTHADLSQLFENALLRIRAGTGLLESLTSVTITHIEEKDFYRLTLSAYLLLQEGQDMLEQAHHKLAKV